MDCGQQDHEVFHGWVVLVTFEVVVGCWTWLQAMYLKSCISI